jgi:hypothetical protein
MGKSRDLNVGMILSVTRRTTAVFQQCVLLSFCASAKGAVKWQGMYMWQHF